MPIRMNTFRNVNMHTITKKDLYQKINQISKGLESKGEHKQYIFVRNFLTINF